ncbi:MAG: MFS transporter [Dehalococcoidia bacterium]
MGRLAFFRQHERLVAISISTVLVMAGQGVIGPVLPLFAKEFGVGAAAVGLTLSMFALARLILNIPLGLLSDRYGRRILLVGGPIVTAVGMIGSGLSPNIEILLGWRFIAGAGSAMYMTGAMIYLTDISTPETRARFIGTNQGALLLGVSIGPGVGGLIAEFWGLRAPFYVVGVAALFAALYAQFRLPETRHLALANERADRERREKEHQAPTTGRPWLTMIRSRDFAAVSLVTMAIFFTRTASRQTLVPLLSVERLDMSPGVLGAIFTAMSVVNMLLITPAAIGADRFGRKKVIVPSMLGTAGGLMLYAGADTYTMFVVASLALSSAMAIAGPAPAAYAADIAPVEARGLAMGLYRTTGDFGFVVGPPLLGALADATSFSVGLGVNAALAIFAGLFFLLFARETVVRKGVTVEAPPPEPVATNLAEQPVAEAEPPPEPASNGAQTKPVIEAPPKVRRALRRGRRDYMGGGLPGRDYMGLDERTALPPLDADLPPSTSRTPRADRPGGLSRPLRRRPRLPSRDG